MTVELEEPVGYRQVWVTLTGRNDARFIRTAVDAQARFVAGWKVAHDDTQPDFLNYITFQAIPRVLFAHSTDKGGNVLGIEGREDDAILFQMQHMVRSAEEARDARAQLLEIRHVLKGANVADGVDVDWEYLGYADGGQNPLATYGTDNVAFLKEVAAKFDPEGVFQTRMPGEFKISKVLYSRQRQYRDS
ncbi:chitinase [Microdochium nivale]|nr:chitinase [Microdochium nivale]